MSLLIRIENDNLLTVDGVQDSSDGSFLNAATVIATLKDEEGVDVTGQTFPLTLTYVTASDGKYTGTLEDTLDLMASVDYTLCVDIDSNTGFKANFQIPIKAIIRGAC